MPHVPKATVVTFRLTERDIWPGCREIQIEGELDLAESDQLRLALDRAAVDRVDVLIDLTACPFIDVSGVTALVKGEEKLLADGCQLLLTGARGQVRRILWVTGLAGAKHGVASRRRPDEDQVLDASRAVGSAA